MRALVTVIFISVCLGSSVRGEEPADGNVKLHPLAHDKTGVSWVYPFAAAKKRATDEKRLLNRRFIAVSFDLSSSGALGDPAARAFVVKAKPELGRNMVGTPPVLVMNAAGEVLAELSNYGSTREMLALLTRTLAENPKFNAYTECKQGNRARISSADSRVSLLNRIGYMGARHPDLIAK